MKFLKLLVPIFLLSIFLVACGSNSANSTNTNSSSSSGSGETSKATINLAHSTNDSEISHYQQYALKFKELVESRTNGDIEVVIHANGTLGGERELTEGVQLGTIDGAIVSSAPLGNFSTLIPVIEFPFLFEDSDHVFEVLNGEIGNEINEDILKSGIKVISWLEVGFGYYSNNVRPIKSPDDLKGVALRTVENTIKIEMEKLFGAEPTPMAFTEVFTALQQGVVDGQSNPLSTIVPNKFHEVQKYISETQHYYQTSLFLMNPELFNSFSEEYQQIILDSAREAQEFEREFVNEMNSEFLKIAEEYGVEVNYKDTVDVEAFKAAVEPLYEQYEDKFGKYFERIRALK